MFLLVLLHHFFFFLSCVTTDIGKMFKNKKSWLLYGHQYDNLPLEIDQTKCHVNFCLQYVSPELSRQICD